MNLYQILGVNSTDSEDVIKKAYRKAVKECHPDTHPGDKKAEERFKKLAEAYSILSDKEKREKYDESILKKENVREKTRHSGKYGYDTVIKPEDFQKEFEKFFSMGNETQKKQGKNNRQVNPMDVSALFERYMGFKS